MPMRRWNQFFWKEFLQAKPGDVVLLSPQEVKSLTEDTAAATFLFMAPVRDAGSEVAGAVQVEVQSDVLFSVLFETGGVAINKTVGRQLLVINNRDQLLADTKAETQDALFEIIQASGSDPIRNLRPDVFSPRQLP